MMSTSYAQPEPCGATVQDISGFAERIGAVLKFQPGADLEPVVSRLNGTIEYLLLDERDSKKASITVEKGGKFTIRLSAAIFPLQKRFSIAHELGHLFLHSRYGEVALEAFHDDERENEQAESEAHEFACAFLMPAKIVNRAAKAFGNDSLKAAAYFMVPEPIARQRMSDVSC